MDDQQESIIESGAKNPGQRCLDDVWPVVILSSVLFAFVYAVPSFVQCMGEMDVPLPWPTLLLFSFITFLRDYWFVSIPVVAELYYLYWTWACANPSRKSWTAATLYLLALTFCVLSIIALCLPLTTTMRSIGPA